jgi:hypothetical protein
MRTEFLDVVQNEHRIVHGATLSLSSLVMAAKAGSNLAAFTRAHPSLETQAQRELNLPGWSGGSDFAKERRRQ